MGNVVAQTRKFFRQRPTGRTLVVIVVVKLLFILVFLRIFFPAAFQGLTEGEKAERVSENLIR